MNAQQVVQQLADQAGEDSRVLERRLARMCRSLAVHLALATALAAVNGWLAWKNLDCWRSGGHDLNLFMAVCNACAGAIMLWSGVLSAVFLAGSARALHSLRELRALFSKYGR